MKYVIELLAAGLILWSAGYLIYDLHRRLKGRCGCGGGCADCLHEGCGSRKKPARCILPKPRRNYSKLQKS